MACKTIGRLRNVCLFINFPLPIISELLEASWIGLYINPYSNFDEIYEYAFDREIKEAV